MAAMEFFHGVCSFGITVSGEGIVFHGRLDLYLLVYFKVLEVVCYIRTV